MVEPSVSTPGRRGSRRCGGHRPGALAGPVAALGAILVCSTSCSSGPDCARHDVPASCPDLRIGARVYDEWRPVVRPAILQEIDDASYPACNHAGRCGGDALSGLGATDVWRLDGVPPTRAVIALREGTGTYVIFVRRGVDPRTVREAVDPRLLGHAAHSG